MSDTDDRHEVGKPPELVAVKQEVEIEEHDLLQHPRVQAVMQTVSVLDYHLPTDREGSQLTPLKSNASMREEIISESNIKTEPDFISVEGCRIKTEEDLILNESLFVLKVVLEDCARELQRSGRYCAECRVLFPSRRDYITHRIKASSISSENLLSQAWDAHTAPKNGGIISDVIKTEYEVPIVQLMTVEEDAAAQANATVEANAGEDAARGSADSCLLRCEHCDYSCAAEDLLRRHNRLHDPARPRECNLCHYRYDKITSLRFHMKMHTKKTFECTLCDYKTFRKDSLTVHTRTHANEKRFECNLCDFRCLRKAYLKDHMRKHTREKPYQCNFCEYRSSLSSTLKKHMVIHTNKKPLECNFCQYKCARRETLNRHIITHTKEKPFKCNMCCFRSARREALKKHSSVAH